jgi:hypothetical protein
MIVVSLEKNNSRYRRGTKPRILGTMVRILLMGIQKLGAYSKEVSIKADDTSTFLRNGNQVESMQNAIHCRVAKAERLRSEMIRCVESPAKR